MLLFIGTENEPTGMLPWFAQGVLTYLAVMAMAAAFELGSTAWERYEFRRLKEEIPRPQDRLKEEPAYE